MQHRVFLDTNILLSFFEVSAVDIDELGRAVELADQAEIVFVSTEIVRDEFFRRREGVIAKSLEDFGSSRIAHIPVMGKTLSSTPDYIEAMKKFEKAQVALERELRDRAIQGTLDADLLIRKFFQLARFIAITPEIKEKARFRAECGSPPGKKGSIGDALNWEALLSLNENRSLTLVSDDTDYRDRLCKSEFNKYLLQEWSVGHKGELKYFQTLSAFVKSELNLPKFGLLAEVDDKIDDLGSSRSFAQTHAAIAELSAISYFSPKQAAYLIEILDFNNQVRWIIGDADVRSFYERLIGDFGEKLEKSQIDFVNGLIESDARSRVGVFG